MAIRVKQYNKELAGRLKRQTLPRGSYFSEPTTAAAGYLAGDGTQPPTPQINPWAGVTPGYSTQLNRYTGLYGTTGEPFAFRMKYQYRTDYPLYINPPPPQGRYPLFADAYVPQMKYPVYGNNKVPALTTYPLYGQNLGEQKDKTYALKTPSVTATNNFVGQSLNDYPASISKETASQLLSGMSFEQQRNVMQTKGYSWVPYNGGFWSKTGAAQTTTQPEMLQPSQPAQPAPIDARGRPEYVDPTTLERGERVTAASGVTFVGGTPTESGQAQYAVTIPGQGDRWKSNVKQDREGNWVRVYYQTYSKAKTKRGRKLAQGRAEQRAAELQAAAVQASVSPAVVPPVAMNQLVNFRVTYG